MGIRDEQVTRLITSVEQNETYLKQNKEEIRMLREEITSLKDIVQRQSILLDKIARGEGNVSVGFKYNLNINAFIFPSRFTFWYHLYRQ